MTVGNADIELGAVTSAAAGKVAIAGTGGATLGDVTLVAAQGVGGPGAATFAMPFESGAKITYQWTGAVLKAWSGLETRVSIQPPRVRYELSTLLDDAPYRGLLSTFAGRAAAAPLFLLGLPYEGLNVVSSTATTIVVDGLSLVDWAVSGQRIVVRSPAGVIGKAIVQSAAGSTIVVDQDLTAIARRGADAMPAMGVYLDADQTMSRYPVAAGVWGLVARGDRPGLSYGSSSIVGTGATLTTFDGLPVWDAGIAIEEASQPVYSGAEFLDLGGQIGMLPSFEVADWGRSIGIESTARADWQWFRLFIHTIRGSQRAFLLPSGRPDLVAIGDASSGTLTIEGPPVEDAPDYAEDWFASLAHRRLRIVLADGTAAYRTVTACAASTGSQDLALNTALAGAIERVEFMETVRLVGDTVVVTWDAGTFESTLQARVVQR